MKRIAIFLSGRTEDKPSLEAALAVAQHSDGHLDVMHAWPLGEFIAESPGKPVPDPEQIIGSGRREARHMFHEVCDGYDRAEFVEIDGETVDAIRAVGTVYDLILLERLSEESGPQAHAFNTALFETGVPVMMTPPEGLAEVGSRVAVVWTGTSQSGRALRSALPFMKAASDVTVLTNSTNDLADPDAALSYLQAHGIVAQHHEFDGSDLTARGRGRAVISAANEIYADLIVMGAFGNNGFERIFDLGRTTRKLVTAAPVPLMLHS